MTEDGLSARKTLRALYHAGTYRPLLTVGIVLLSLVVAALEGIGLGFILPIIEVAQSTEEATSGPVRVFAQLYELLGIPFTLTYIIAGVTLIIGVRYTASFLMEWLAVVLQTHYTRELRTRAFENALDARITYFDQQGSDEILNTIITQTQFAGRTIQEIVRIFELVFVSLAFIAVALYLAPVLMVGAGLVLGGFMYGIRHMLESGYSVGGRLADANEGVQEAVQAGVQGIRDVKLFQISNELFANFRDAVNRFTDATIAQRRNQLAIANFNQFITAATVFVLIYVGLRISSLTLGSLGVFLFAMFRLGPKLSNLNDVIYQTESDLPHLVRTQEFIERLERNKEPTGEKPVPTPLHQFAFQNVVFEYDSSGEQVLQNVSFDIERGEFIAFVGSSGAGKSTIVSLLVRMYDPDEGQILADGTPINAFDISEYRSQVSLVRQNPFIFNETLRYNITVGNRDATQEEVKEVCEIAKVTEFLDDLPHGYDTMLGDDGVRLSGGQRQRVAIARALLKEADLLILDEATSDLDSHLEQKVHSGIEAMNRDYAMVVIAHRLSTVTNADRIHVMDDGHIAEVGSHEELLRQNEEYSRLYDIQSRRV